jgi:hypothetical protein
VRQEIEYTDFPLPTIKFYVCGQQDEHGNRSRVVMLPNEY